MSVKSKYRTWDYHANGGKGAWRAWIKSEFAAPVVDTEKQYKSRTDPTSGQRWITGKRSGKIVFNDYGVYKFALSDGSISISALRAEPQNIEESVEGSTKTPGTDYVVKLVTELCESVKVNDEMVTLALADSKSAEYDLLTELGELPETIGMFRDLLAAFTGRAKSMHEHLKRIRKRSADEKQKMQKAYDRYRKKTRRRVTDEADDYEIWSKWVKKYEQGRKRALAEAKARRKSRELLNPKQPKQLGRIVDKATETWLLYRYGIMPLVYSAQDIMKLLEGKQNAYQTSRQRRIRKEKDKVLWESNQRITDLPIQPSHVPLSFRTSYELTERVTIKTCFTGSNLTRKLGLNPAVTAWELTRLSFVVDWFIQVGDFIQALSPSFADQTACVYSRKIKGTVRTVIQSEKFSYTSNPGAISHYRVSGSGISGEFESYYRVVVDPTSHITIPAELQLNWKRQVDAFALAWPKVKNALSSIVKDHQNGKIQPDSTQSKRSPRRKRH